MCQSIERPSGVDVETYSQLVEFVNGGQIVKLVESDDLGPDDCLCAVYIEGTLEANGIAYEQTPFGFEVEINQLLAASERAKS